MKFLFVFAHPDDETVASGGTMALLAQAGHSIRVICTTDGSAGEVSPESQSHLLEHGSVAQLRRSEFAQACELLGVESWAMYDYRDGELTNQDVWGRLKTALKLEIEAYRPDVVITFDHTGWYFHLDHVGTSIATTLAVQASEVEVPLLFLTYLRIGTSKWKYAYPPMPISHQVDVSEVKELKLKALALHASQDTSTVDAYVESQTPHLELFQVSLATDGGKTILNELTLFTPVTTESK